MKKRVLVSYSSYIMPEAKILSSPKTSHISNLFLFQFYPLPVPQTTLPEIRKDEKLLFNINNKHIASSKNLPSRQKAKMFLMR